MTIQDKPSALAPHLFERSASRLASVVGLADEALAARLAAPPPAPSPPVLAPTPGAEPGLGARLPPPSAELARRLVQALSPVPVSPTRIDAATLQRAGVVDIAKGRSRSFEEFRIVQDQVLRLLAADCAAGVEVGKLVMVTSAAPREGKTFVSANLAASIARCTERRVLLVDTDPKPGSLSAVLGLGRLPGLLELAEDLTPAPTVYETCLPRLLMVPIGGSSERSVRTAVGQVPAALQRIAALFPGHVIVLDAPPCLASSDASMLAGIVDQVVMVVAAGETQRGDLEAALDLVQACRNIALLLNKVRATGGSGFGSYGDYA